MRWDEQCGQRHFPETMGDWVGVRVVCTPWGVRAGTVAMGGSLACSPRPGPKISEDGGQVGGTRVEGSPTWPRKTGVSHEDGRQE